MCRTLMHANKIGRRFRNTLRCRRSISLAIPETWLEGTLVRILLYRDRPISRQHGSLKCFDDKRHIVIAKHFTAREIAASFAAILLCKECSRTLSIYYYYSRKSADRAKENNIISLFLYRLSNTGRSEVGDHYLRLHPIIIPLYKFLSYI